LCCCTCFCCASASTRFWDGIDRDAVMMNDERLVMGIFDGDPPICNNNGAA